MVVSGREQFTRGGAHAHLITASMSVVCSTAAMHSTVRLRQPGGICVPRVVEQVYLGRRRRERTAEDAARADITHVPLALHLEVPGQAKFLHVWRETTHTVKSTRRAMVTEVSFIGPHQGPAR